MTAAISNQTIAYMDVTARVNKRIGRDAGSFAEAVDKSAESAPVHSIRQASTTGKSSAVEEFKRKHPKEAGHVDKQVSSGLRAKEVYGASGVDTSEMTMDEYKHYIGDILDKIPFDATRPYDEEVIYISDEGWEQMKNDPDYEAWVLGYNVENRSVKNPFFGMGDKGCFAVEHFGASIEEHHGEGFSKVYGGTAGGARSMFEAMASGSGGLRKNAPKAREQPPEDWSLEKERRKKRDIWDELFETQLQVREQLRERLNRDYYEKQRSSQKMAAAQMVGNEAFMK